MPAAHEPALALIPASAPDAAASVTAAWDRGDAVFVAPEGTPIPNANPEPGDAAFVRTSGTTGEPRVAALTRAGLDASAQMVASAIGATSSDPWLCCLPLTYVAGLAVVGRAYALGAPCVVHDGFDALRVANTIADEDIAFTSLVGTALRRLLDLGAPLQRLKGILLGGGPIDHALVAAARAGGIAVHTTYGMTETWGGIVHDGHPLPGVELRLGGPGNDDIEVRTPSAMRGYVNDAAGTRAAWTDDGWLRTGDIGAWNDDGTIAVVDRRKDLIITGGVNVIPSVVDTALQALPMITDGVVVGLPDAEWGERVVAYIVSDDPPTVDELRAALRGAIPDAALPREVRIVATIPRTGGGKVLRRMLRDEGMTSTG